MNKSLNDILTQHKGSFTSNESGKDQRINDKHQRKFSLSPPRGVNGPFNGAFTFPDTDTDTDNNKLTLNPMGLSVGVCLCAV